MWPPGAFTNAPASPLRPGVPRPSQARLPGLEHPGTKTKSGKAGSEPLVVTRTFMTGPQAVWKLSAYLITAPQSPTGKSDISAATACQRVSELQTAH